MAYLAMLYEVEKLLRWSFSVISFG